MSPLKGVQLGRSTDFAEIISVDRPSQRRWPSYLDFSGRSEMNPSSGLAWELTLRFAVLTQVLAANDDRCPRIRPSKGLATATRHDLLVGWRQTSANWPYLFVLGLP